MKKLKSIGDKHPYEKIAFGQTIQLFNWFRYVLNLNEMIVEPCKNIFN